MKPAEPDSNYLSSMGREQEMLPEVSMLASPCPASKYNFVPQAAIVW